MESSQAYSTDDGIYFSEQSDIIEAIQRKDLESRGVEQHEQLGYKVYDGPEWAISNGPTYENDEINDLEDVYVLPPPNQTRIQSQEQVVPRQTRRGVVQDLYDEDHYAIANVNACPTREFGVLRDPSNDEKSQTGPRGKTSIVTKKNMTIFGLIIFLMIVGAISVTMMSISEGIVYVSLSNKRYASCINILRHMIYYIYYY